MSIGAAFNALGLAVCAFVYVRRAARAGLARDAALEAAALGVVGALVGSRVVAGLFSHENGLADMLRGKSGAMSWGAYAGGFFAASIRVHTWRRSRWLEHLDAAAPAVLAGIAIARLGCFAQGDDFGVVCHYAWCVEFGRATDAFAVHRALGWVAPNASSSLPVEPLQIYLSMAAAISSAVVTLTERRRSLASTTRVGATALLGLLLYTLSRAPLELLRETAGETHGIISSASLAAVQLCAALVLAAVWACLHSAVESR